MGHSAVRVFAFSAKPGGTEGFRHKTGTALRQDCALQSKSHGFRKPPSAGLLGDVRQSALNVFDRTIERTISTASNLQLGDDCLSRIRLARQCPCAERESLCQSHFEP